MSPLLTALNPAQRDAVETLEGPLLVLAGAGSGKTRVITTRIAYLMEKGVAPSNILAVTFTNKAAGEMRDRVQALAGARAKELTIGTFHAFSVRLLREHGASALGLSPSFTICDSADQLSAVKSVMRELRVHETAMHPSAVLARISLAKNRMEAPGDDLVSAVFERYREHLARSRTLDFDDLLLESVRLLKEHPKVRDSCRKRYRYVLVDEYQDTNRPQYEIVREIGGTHRNVCVVGDDDQSIYGFRGADVQKILGFHRDFKGAKVVRLETNYRSTRPILDAANAVIRNNPDRHGKTLASALGDGEPVRLMRLPDETTEAQFVVDEILRLVRRSGARLSDVAVLFRTQVQPRPFEAELRSRGIPYVLVGGMSFFDRKEVRDLVAFLRIASNPDDEQALLRILNTPPRGIGKTTVDRLLAFATAEGISAANAFERAGEIEGMNPDAIEAYGDLRARIARVAVDRATHDLPARLGSLVEAVDYKSEVRRLYSDPMTREARWAGVEEMLNFAENYTRRASSPTLQGFLEELALTSGDEPSERESPGEAVSLMTLHSAKGLEFPHVFLVGMEEGLLPHARAVADGACDEERRLAYVGITRAMRTLTLSLASERAKYGKRVAAMPSRFVYEMRDKTPPVDWIPIEASLVAGSREPLNGPSDTESSAAPEGGHRAARPDRRSRANGAPRGKRPRSARSGPRGARPPKESPS
ncbi:MAG TPA: UvrD-helicase domain-containing protein [Vicinamibacteria bacterium]|nr:UvrD-helicase domain-containing protein [Vicinamibacteria bacterium]